MQERKTFPCTTTIAIASRTIKTCVNFFQIIHFTVCFSVVMYYCLMYCSVGLQSGTYGARALKRIPKPTAGGKGKKVKKAGSKQSLNTTSEMLPPYSTVPPIQHSTPAGTLEHPPKHPYPEQQQPPQQGYPGQPTQPPVYRAYEQPGYQEPLLQSGYPMSDLRGPPTARHVKLVGVPEAAESDL